MRSEITRTPVSDPKAFAMHRQSERTVHLSVEGHGRTPTERADSLNRDGRPKDGKDRDRAVGRSITLGAADHREQLSIHFFAPRMIHSLSSRRASARRPSAGADAAKLALPPGSLNAKAASGVSSRLGATMRAPAPASRSGGAQSPPRWPRGKAVARGKASKRRRQTFCLPRSSTARRARRSALRPAGAAGSASA